MFEVRGQNEKQLIRGALVLVAIVAACLIFTFTGHLQQICSKLFEIFQGREHLRTYLESWGAWGPSVFVILQALQVVIAPIPGELSGVVGGFVFGTFPSVFYSTLGLTIGSVIAFFAARIIGLPFVKMVVSQETLEKFRFVTERKGIIISLILFIVPGFPKDILCYLLGLSPMGFVTFVLVCGLGRIPGTVMLSFSGAAIFEEDWRLLVILIIVSAVCLVVFYFKGEKASLWLEKKSSGDVALDD
jgi:uncharacterized membrane protein YdjX (TVP38/TMEM64 family)